MNFNLFEAIASVKDRRMLCRLVSVSCLICNARRKGKCARHIVVDRISPDGVIMDRIGIFLEGQMAEDVTLRIGHVMKLEYFFTPMDGRVVKSIVYVGSVKAFFGRTRCVHDEVTFSFRKKPTA